MIDEFSRGPNYYTNNSTSFFFHFPHHFSLFTHNLFTLLLAQILISHQFPFSPFYISHYFQFHTNLKAVENVSKSLQKLKPRFSLRFLINDFFNKNTGGASEWMQKDELLVSQCFVKISD